MKTPSAAVEVESRVRSKRSAFRVGLLGVFIALLGAVLSLFAVAAPSSAAASFATNTAPVVTTQPTSQLYTTGQTLTFTAAASGTPTPTVQWQLLVNRGRTGVSISVHTS